MSERIKTRLYVLAFALLMNAFLIACDTLAGRW